MQRSPSQVKGVGFRSLSRRGSWVRIPPSAPEFIESRAVLVIALTVLVALAVVPVT